MSYFRLRSPPRTNAYAPPGLTLREAVFPRVALAGVPASLHPWLHSSRPSRGEVRASVRSLAYTHARALPVRTASADLPWGERTHFSGIAYFLSNEPISRAD